MKTTIERLNAILVKDYMVAPESLELNAPLEALGIDSLGMAELLFHLEDEFKISLSQESAPLQTIGDVVSYIDTLLMTQNTSVTKVSASQICTDKVSDVVATL